MKQGRPRALTIAIAAMLGVRAGVEGLATALPGLGQQQGVESPRPSQTKLRKAYRSWQRSGRKGLPSPRARHNRKRPPRSWRRARVRKLRARRRGRA